MDSLRRRRLEIAERFEVNAVGDSGEVLRWRRLNIEKSWRRRSDWEETFKVVCLPSNNLSWKEKDIH